MTEINRTRCGSSNLAESCSNLQADKHRIFISRIRHKSNLSKNGSATLCDNKIVPQVRFTETDHLVKVIRSAENSSYPLADQKTVILV